MTLNDFVWPFYVKFSLLRTSLFTYLLYSLFTRVTSGDMRKRNPQNIWDKTAIKLRICRRRYVVGTLTNKANISI